MFKWLKDAFRFDGIQDNEISPDSDWHYLSPMERLGIQTQADADIAKKIIEERKRMATPNAKVSGRPHDKTEKE